jgi:hypothetical protein
LHIFLKLNAHLVTPVQAHVYNYHLAPRKLTAVRC